MKKAFSGASKLLTYIENSKLNQTLMDATKCRGSTLAALDFGAVFGGSNQVRICTDAPGGFQIMREELLESDTA